MRRFWGGQALFYFRIAEAKRRFAVKRCEINKIGVVALGGSGLGSGAEW
jgi:hypothetical protein